MTWAAVKNLLEVLNGTLTDRYLGLPSDVGCSKNGSFKYLKDRVWKRVEGWMAMILSSGGKEAN